MARKRVRMQFEDETFDISFIGFERACVRDTDAL